jgi:hypothetical protein
MTYLRQVFISQEPGNLRLAQHSIALGQDAEILQLVILDVCLVLLREQIRVDPVPAALRKNDASMHVLVQAFLEDPATQIVGLPLHDFSKCLAEFVITDVSLARHLGEPSDLKGPHGLLSPSHEFRYSTRCYQNQDAFGQPVLSYDHEILRPRRLPGRRI